MNVKEWRPAEGCESCKRAVRLFHEHTGIAAHTNSLAYTRIRKLEVEVMKMADLLEIRGQRIRELETEVARWKTALTGLQKDYDMNNVRANIAEAKVARVLELPEKWRSQAHRLNALNYEAVAMAISACADELEAAEQEPEHE